MSFLRSTLKSLLGPHTAQTLRNSRSIKRWVAPTLRELRKRAKKLGPQEPSPRSEFIEWSYKSELFAFGKRLNENFELSVLQTAFTNSSYIQKEAQRQRELGIEEVDIQMSDNSELTAIGRKLSKEYVAAYLRHSLPKVPEEGQKAIAEYLLSQSSLANISSHLGVKDLAYSAEYPPSEETMANTLLAVIGALKKSSGTERAFEFVRDFVCTQLNQRDFLDMWKIKNPVELLKSICKGENIGELEPRLIGDCGRNTVLAAYQVGFYANKEMLGMGFGENIETAIEAAALNTLHKIFGINDTMTPFNFKIKIEPIRAKITV